MARSRSMTLGGFNQLETVNYTQYGVTSVAYETYSGTLVNKHITDVQTPGFHSLKKCGKFLPLNPVEIDTTTEKRLAGPVDSYYGAGSPGEVKYAGSFAGSFTATHVVPEPIDGDLLNSAVLTASANAASAEWDVLTFMAEIKKTAQTMQTIGRHFNVKTGQLARTAARYKRDPWGAFRELWLGARYSIRPLIYDYMSAAQALRALSREILILDGKGHNGTSHSDEWSLTTPTAYGRIEQRETLTQDLSYRGAAYCKYEKALNTAFQIDPLVTMYELAPYSFVVDWFINIGGWVRTLRPMISGSFLGVQESIREDTLLTASKVNHYTVAPYSGYFDEGRYEKRMVKYTRNPTSVPFPPVVLDLTLPRIVDLVTLFIGGKTKVIHTLNGRR